MISWWYIHTATLYQLCCRWTPDDIYIPKLYINFPAVVHVMIYTYRNFIFPADKYVMIYTYHNFISTFLQLNTGWYIHTATLNQLSCSWTPVDICILHLYINFPADEHPMIYTYRNFISIFQQINTGWYIHTATLYQLSWSWTTDDIYIYTTTLYQLCCSWTPDDIYISQLYINFPADEHLMIYTYRHFISTFLHINTWWYIHTATLYELSSI